MLPHQRLNGMSGMQWRGRKGSGNIEDRRSVSGARAGGVGGIGLVAVLVIGYFLGIDVTPLLQQGGVPSSEPVEMTAEDQAAAEFASVSLRYTEEIWTKVFREQLNKPYKPVTLVLFKGVTPSPCGDASGATGPFYCPGDKKVYLDTDFFTTMEKELGARGDFAMAYVVAHEVGHHIQDSLGILGKANSYRAQVSEAESNEISVRIELQADCLSGIWARGVQEQLGAIEQGDFEEAFDAAKRIGDDTLQRNAGRRPSPESFTHGSAQQRSSWFVRGLNSGELADCDTFRAQQL
jgi:predicted metalloprotease